MPKHLFEDLSLLPQVEAIALGGSRAGEYYDEKSDYDVYVYCKEPVSEGIRKDILSKYCSYLEIGNHFWEYEDNCVLNSGIDIDILYRDLDGFAEDIERVVVQHQAQNGYTTCMWYNLLNSKILFDRTGRLAQLQKRYTIPSPQELKKAIVERNRKLLRGAMPAYETQIAKAVGRRDIISVNHRTAEFMASYFDVVFALNEQLHPGEKRLIDLCEKNCKLLPGNFRQNLERLFSNLFTYPNRVAADIDEIVKELEEIC